VVKVGLRTRVAGMSPTNSFRRKSGMSVGWRVARGRATVFGSFKTKFELLVIEKNN
jgi:hypothetical protein